MSLIQMQFRRGTAATWTSVNPILADGELGLETDTGQFKIGNGVATWTARPYGGIQGPAGTPGTSPNAFTTITGNSGTATADTSSDTLAVTGTGQVNVVAADTPDGLTVSLANATANSVFGEFTGSAAAPQYLGIPANTFPARSSTGNLTAKTITDAGVAWLSNANIAAMTAALDVATTTTKGLLSFADKKIIDSLHYDAVADFGFVGNDSTLNDAAWTTAKSTMPVGAVLFFPAGTYRVANEMTIDVDKRFQFRGVGRYTSIIKTTSATAHIFNKSIAGWYDTWSDLGFQSSVTKTAGAAINIPAGNNVGMNCYRLWMTGMFHGINATGAQSANLSVWSDLDISGVTNGGRGIVINGSTINVQIHNTTINAGAATTSACVEINQSGAVQVTSFDWIQGTNVLLINSTGGAGPQACYFTNGFCDQPAGSVIKIIGTNTANRLKFTAVGIAPTGNNYAVEIAGTGAGAVGTSTALPAGISIVDCDIYSQNGTNTSAGIFMNGVQDVNIQNCRITGFGGAGGCAIRCTPSSGNQTKLRVNGCILGPNSNLTVTNTVGVQIDAGASGPSVLSITDNTMTGSTTAIINNMTAFADAQVNINNNAGAVSGFSTQATPNATVLTTAETVVMVIPLPPNSVKVGTTALLDLSWKPTLTTVNTVRFRIGPSATVPATNTSVSAIADLTNANTKSCRAQMTVWAVGGAATQVANGVMNQTTVTATSANVGASGSFNSAVQNYLMVTLQNTSSTTSIIFSGGLEVISPS